jgi:uncharacterized protein (DUF433 family)
MNTVNLTTANLTWLQQNQIIVPFVSDPHGTVRIGGTRVTLATVISSFQEGATAEEIVFQYPTLELADVYAVISYYLKHRPEMEEYLLGQQQLAEQVRQQHEERFQQQGIRDRLLARQAQQRVENRVATC